MAERPSKFFFATCDVECHFPSKYQRHVATASHQKLDAILGMERQPEERSGDDHKGQETCEPSSYSSPMDIAHHVSPFSDASDVCCF